MPFKRKIASAFGSFFVLISLAACVTERVQPVFPSQVAVGGPPYQLYAPEVAVKDASTPRPLVVVLHGCLQSADAMMKSTRMNEEADRAGFYVLYPEQKKGRHPLNCWRWFDPANRRPGSEELSAVLEMIKDVQSKHAIDGSRIYATGLSSGAGTAASLLACYPQTFAGGALIAAPGFGISTTENEAQTAMAAAPSRKSLKKEVCQPSAFKGKLLILAGARDRTVQPLHSALLSEQFTTNTERKVKKLSSLHLVYPGELPYQMVCFGKPARVCRVEVQGMEHAWSGGDLYPFSEPRGPSTSELIRRFIVEGELPHPQTKKK